MDIQAASPRIKEVNPKVLPKGNVPHRKQIPGTHTAPLLVPIGLAALLRGMIPHSGNRQTGLKSLRFKLILNDHPIHQLIRAKASNLGAKFTHQNSEATGIGIIPRREADALTVLTKETHSPPTKRFNKQLNLIPKEVKIKRRLEKIPREEKMQIRLLLQLSISRHITQSTSLAYVGAIHAMQVLVPTQTVETVLYMHGLHAVTLDADSHLDKIHNANFARIMQPGAKAKLILHLGSSLARHMSYPSMSVCPNF